MLIYKKKNRMNKISDYKILQADSSDKLQEEVMNSISKGFVLTGGVCVVQILQFGSIFYQAICMFSE